MGSFLSVCGRRRQVAKGTATASQPAENVGSKFEEEEDVSIPSMTKLILSTGNIVSGGPSIMRKPGEHRSNLELVNSLRSNFHAHKHHGPSPTEPAGQERQHTPTSPPASGIADKDPAQVVGAGTVGAGASSTGASSPTQPATSEWTAQEGNALYVPGIDWPASGLLEEAAQYDITAKLFFLPTTPVARRAEFAREAVDLVLRELRAPAIQLLIVSFPGVSFEKDCEWEADKLNASQGNDEEEAASWAGVEPLHREGRVQRLGIAEFGSTKLERLLRAVQIRPSVDQINIKDCCNVPPPLTDLAKIHGIELHVHRDCTNILPKGTLRELLGPAPAGAGVLAEAGGAAETKDGGLRGDLNPRWVIKYTAVIANRGVIENKGYFAGAELDDE